MSANGRLGADELVYVEDNDQLNRVAAYWFRKARAAWYVEGGRGSCIVEPAGAYRSWQVQYDMKHGIPSLAYWNLSLKSKIGLASAGNSTHGWGDRVDAAPGFNAFLLRRGREFGAYREFGDADPNHWKFYITTIPAGGDADIIEEPEDHDRMKIIHKVVNNVQSFALIAGDTVLPLSKDTAEALVPALGLSQLTLAPSYDTLISVGAILDAAEATRVATAVVAALPASSGGVGVTPEVIAAIAKAVNDDAAERLAE